MNRIIFWAAAVTFFGVLFGFSSMLGQDLYWSITGLVGICRG